MKFNSIHFFLILSTYNSIAASPDALALISSICSLFSNTPFAINSLKLNFFTGCIPNCSKIVFQCLGLKSWFPRATITGSWLEILFTFDIKVYNTLSLDPSEFRSLYYKTMLLFSNYFMSLSTSSVFSCWKSLFNHSSLFLLNLSTLLHNNFLSLYLFSNSINSLLLELIIFNSFWQWIYSLSFNLYLSIALFISFIWFLTAGNSFTTFSKF